MPPVTPFTVIISAVTATITALLAIYAWRHLRVPGAASFLAMMVAFTEWLLAFILTLAAPSLAGKLLWAKVQYLGALVAPLAWLAFVFEYTGRGKWLSTRHILGALVIPAITMALLLTNESHGLMWSATWIDINLRVSHGGWYWVNLAYSNLLVLAGMGLLVKVVLGPQQQYRSQAMAILLGGLSTWVWTIFYVTNSNRPFVPELTPIALCTSVLVFAWGLFRFRLLDIVPIAREAVIDSMQDGMIVLGKDNRIVDHNPAGRNILGLGNRQLIGQVISDIIPDWPEWTDPRSETPNDVREITLGGESNPRDYELRISSLRNRHKETYGWLIILNDITARVRAEKAESEQRALADALRDTSAALNSTLRLDEVFERILTNVGRVAPHDAVNIMLVEKGEIRVACHRGYDEGGLAESLMALRIPVEKVVNFRYMAETGNPLIIPEVSNYPGWDPIKGTEWLRSYAAAPIRHNGETVGFLNLDSRTPGFFKPEDAERLQAFVDQAAIAVANARMYSEMQQMALTDAPTGLYNRRALFDLGYREVERARRFNRPLAALMVDLDHLKDVNDTYGHLVGDQVIKALVDCCQETTRTVDIIGRYGGDEFVILLPENDLETAARVAERLRTSIAKIRVVTQTGMIVRVTVSVGVATLNDTITDLTGLIDLADRALYAAKEGGRNQVCAPKVNIPE